jgi:hypothetical protein
LVERLALGRALHLNETAVPVHHDVHAHVGAYILVAAQIEQRLAAHHADTVSFTTSSDADRAV